MLHAEFSIAPLLLLAAFAVVSSLAKRKPRGAPQRPAALGTPEEPRAGFMAELRRAMDELQQVQQQQQPSPQPQALVAADWLARQQQRKALAAQVRARPGRSVVPLEDDDADKTSESVVSLEGRDYDDDIERTIDARRQAVAHRAVRVDESSEGLSTLQQARRASRPDLAIGGSAEHAAWHGEIGKSVATDQTAKPVSRLARFADGSARSAIILGEILRPPVGQRDA